MTRASKTRNALFTSIISLLLCVSMLVGTTFAWFTDTVSTGTNTIQSGNLDLLLEYYDGNSWKEVTSSTELFDDATKWEPGYTEVAYLRVTNKGSLAFKYNGALTISQETEGTNVAGNQFKLSSYLKYAVLEPTSETIYKDRNTALAAAADANPSTFANHTFASGEKVESEKVEYFTIIVYMPTDVGNEANHKTGTTAPSIKFGISFTATQVEYEKDSFGNDYDKDAQLPATINTVVTADEQTLNEDGTNAVAIAVVEAAGDVSGSIPENAIVGTEGEVITPALEVTTTASTDTSVTYNVEFVDAKTGEEISFTEGSAVTATIKVGAGLTNVGVTHNGTEVFTKVSTVNELTDGTFHYDSATGVITVCSDSYSPYTVTFEKPSDQSQNVTVQQGNGYTAVETYSELETVFANGGKVVLASNVALTKGLTIPANVDVTLDLNGYTLSYASTETTGNAAITNKGTLTINDSIGGGKVTYSGIPGGSANYVTNTITNLGTLTVNGGTIENTTEDTGNTSFAIDSSNSVGNAEVVINNGHVVANARAVRQFLSSGTEYVNNLTINGGIVESITNRTVWLQLASSDAAEAPYGTLTVTGGTLTTTGLSAINTGTYGASFKNVAVTISGGTINGEVTLNHGETGATVPSDGYVTASITGGTFTINNYSGNFIKANSGTVAITGGTFYVDSYDELKSAMSAQGNVEIILAADIEAQANELVVNKDADITLDLNGYTISHESEYTGYKWLLNVSGDAALQIKDSGENGSMNATVTSSDSSWGSAFAMIFNEGTLIIDDGNFELNVSSYAWGYVVDLRPNAWATAYETAATFTLNGGTLSASGEDAIRVAYNSSTNHTTNNVTFTMNGGTINGYSAVFMQQLDNEFEQLNAVINGGTLNVSEYVFRIYSGVTNSGTDYTHNDGVEGTVNNITIDSDVTITGDGGETYYVKTPDVTNSITGCDNCTPEKK